MMNHIIECVSTRRTPVVTAEDGLAAVRVADAIMRSRGAGQEVDVEWGDEDINIKGRALHQTRVSEPHLRRPLGFSSAGGLD